MSTIGLRDFRPKLHFTPISMWMNDPNGLVYENGNYHLFYQYHPGSTVWGPMHWGHARSRDLINWEHLPSALYPDQFGTIFSGCAVYDKENTSGFGAFGCLPMVAMYTQHLPGLSGIKSDKLQRQSVAYSLDGVNFHKYEGNPVIENPGISDFRDPKIFYNPVRNGWGMVLAAGDRVLFYFSCDLLHWEKTGEFGPQGNLASGVWECPDLFPLDSPDGEKWVLLVSMGMKAEHGGSRTQYFIGSFDGSQFIPDREETQPLWLDEGFDNYAGVTFDNAPKRLLIGWADNWIYAASCPTGEFCGSMTLVRELRLVKTKTSGIRLASYPSGLGACIKDIRNATSRETLANETFGLSIIGKGPSRVVLENSVGQQLCFGVNGNNEMFVDRINAGATHFNPSFASAEYGRKEAARLFDGEYILDAVFDVSQLELFIDRGTVSMSSLVFPDTPYCRITLEGDIQARFLNLK